MAEGAARLIEGSWRQVADAKAKAVCARCLVRRRYLAFALRT